MEDVELTVPAGPSRLALIGATAAGIVLVLFILVLATSSGESGLGPSPLIAKAAPVIEGTATDGSTFSLESQRGRWVVVNFFATTCVPCIREHPELVAFDKAHTPVGDASVVSIAFSDSSSNVREFFLANGGDWSVLAEDAGRHAISYGVAAVPETFLVSPNGVVMTKFIGGVTQADLDAEIARLSGTVGNS
jgi:cytochrome c biogenesis protein CcmG/thiol:disulfide interchange protein DsbE